MVIGRKVFYCIKRKPSLVSFRRAAWAVTQLRLQEQASFSAGPSMPWRISLLEVDVNAMDMPVDASPISKGKDFNYLPVRARIFALFGSILWIKTFTLFTQEGIWSRQIALCLPCWGLILGHFLLGMESSHAIVDITQQDETASDASPSTWTGLGAGEPHGTRTSVKVRRRGGKEVLNSHISSD